MPARRCSAKTHLGTQCAMPAPRGALVCGTHKRFKPHREPTKLVAARDLIDEVELRVADVSLALTELRAVLAKK